MGHGNLDYFWKPPLKGRPSTKPGDHGTPNAHNHWFILFYHVWGPAWIEIHWNSIWLRAWSHMASHYTWGSVTILHDFGGALGWPLDNFFWALIISRSRLLAHAWSGPKYHEQYSTAIAHNKNNNIRLLILLLYIDTHQRVGSSYFPVKIKLTPQETHPHIQLFLCQSPKSLKLTTIYTR